MLTAFQFLLEVMTSLPALVKAGVDVYDIIVDTNAKVAAMQDEGRGATQEERDAMRAMLEDLRAGRPDV